MTKLAQYLGKGIELAIDIENEDNDMYIGREAGSIPAYASDFSFDCMSTRPARGKGGSFVG